MLFYGFIVWTDKQKEKRLLSVFVFEIHVEKTALKRAFWSFRVVTLPCYHGYNRYTYK